MSMKIKLSEKDIIRFKRKFNIGNGCWKWTDKPVKNGYAQFGIGGKSYRANRISYSLFKGKIPKGKFVLHHCDNPICVNPKHLFIGTQKDNIRDCINKGRFTIGSKNGCSKLTENQVKEIRSLYGKYGHRGLIQRKLAKLFNVSRVLISDITRGKTWKHVKSS